MKKVYIIHGWGGSSNEAMIQWLKSETEKRGYTTITPNMPDTDTPTISAWVSKLQELISPDVETVLVGHSIGCQAVLRYLEALDRSEKVTGIVLIAPWMELDQKTIEEEGQEIVDIAEPWMKTPINFKKVRSQIGKSVCIFSNNDPYVPLSQKDLFERELDSEIIIENNKGHFTESDNTTSLPSALDAILKINL
jgi:hypothetical protein